MIFFILLFGPGLLDLGIIGRGRITRKGHLTAIQVALQHVLQLPPLYVQEDESAETPQQKTRWSAWVQGVWLLDRGAED